MLTVSRFTVVLIALLLWVLTGCGPGGDPAIVGKWKAKDSEHVIEIKSNGDWVEPMEKDLQVRSSKWEWDGTNRIRITVDTKIVGKASGVMKVTLNGDSLTLKDEDGATDYVRVK
jgi:hypothetical protein